MIIYVTDIDKFSNQKSFLENIKNSSLFGIEYIQIRFKNLDQNSKTILTQKINGIIDKSNTKLIINSDYKSSKIISAYGFHMTSSSKLNGSSAKKISGSNWISKSIHSKNEILKNNNDKDINAFVIGTVFPSNSHPNGKTLGIENFKDLVKLSKKPVIAIGGIDSQNISTIVKSGADGVAMISELANSSNLKNLIKKLKSHYE
jgi:thiamine-phosphate diphosphorylase|tara:strand:- start:2812 stop:3420 length:609 start_codon:yes stop_codon:yes gene_type:complete